MAKGSRSKGVLKLIHIDVCGPLNVTARGGFEYFFTFINDFPRYVLKGKTEKLETELELYDFVRYSKRIKG